VFIVYRVFNWSDLGRYVPKVTWSDGQVRIGSFYLQPEDGGKNCMLYDQRIGECIQCLPGFVLESRNCYERIEFCAVQTGNICVKC